MEEKMLLNHYTTIFEQHHEVYAELPPCQALGYQTRTDADELEQCLFNPEAHQLRF